MKQNPGHRGMRRPSRPKKEVKRPRDMTDEEKDLIAQYAAETAQRITPLINRAIEVMMEWGHTADLHKGWVLDQVARALAGYRDGEDDDTYRAFLAEYERRTGEEWDMGIEP